MNDAAVRRRLAFLLPLTLAGCAAGERVDGVTQPIAAFCSAEVIVSAEPRETVVVDVETEYLPRVVNCENGGAAFEALKAQAVSARTYLYYRLARTGDIADGTSDQVFGCDREPREEHYEAVRATQGEVLQYMEETIAGFYVAGSRQTPPECRGGTDDPTNTERFVTYNEGLSGDGVEQTTLGWVNPGNIYNRGCLSQNGSHCLAESGWGYEDILRFYYGTDIELVTAEGACVEPSEPEDAGAVADDAGPAEDAAAAGDDASVAAPDAGPSVGVRSPTGGGSLGSGCAVGVGAVGVGARSGALPWLVALAFVRLRRRRQRR